MIEVISTRLLRVILLTFMKSCKYLSIYPPFLRLYRNKVQIFCEGHQNLGIAISIKIKRKIVPNFCGLVRKPELYLVRA